MNTAFRAAGTALAGLVAIAWAGAALAQDATAGDPKRGGEVFKAQCAVCHTAEKGKASPIGPSLYGIVGRPAGSLEGFRYSDAMKKVGVAWTPANLDKYLENPWQIAPGTPMALVVPVVKNRQDVIAYLKSVGPQ
jgi:cytochrome c